MIFRVTHAFRHRRLGHTVLLPGDYTEAQLTARYPRLPQDLIANRRGYWLEDENVKSDVHVAVDETVGAVTFEVVEATARKQAEKLMSEILDDMEATPPESLDYRAMSVDELTEYAQQIGIYDSIEGTGANGNIKKADLVQALEGRE